ncbi:3,4-dihydroxy-2-butanone-4-phosphate synthase [Amycolatopsis thermoflava]|uniref:3,4-dihydroxy-2-butanone-4-phosphate synthase n=1 Tax=Amycolatopsis thermoflava TaxID=84480 RepID=UPI00040BF356|nr:3,4-dihydroxy-2-butanone-4-phosphate synthase [Amycolatopsis thermoflava]
MTVLQESTTDTAIGALRAGRPVVLLDDLGPHPERELVFAARSATTALVAGVVRCTSGFLVVTLPEPEADRLRLAAQSPADRGAPAYGVSVDAEGVGTGISAADRARTISLLGTPGTAPDVFTRPGHVITYRAHPDGVLGRATGREAAFDLVRLAGAGFAVAGAALTSDEPLPGLPVVTASGVLAHRLSH